MKQGLIYPELAQEIEAWAAGPSADALTPVNVTLWVRDDRDQVDDWPPAVAQLVNLYAGDSQFNSFCQIEPGVGIFSTLAPIRRTPNGWRVLNTELRWRRDVLEVSAEGVCWYSRFTAQGLARLFTALRADGWAPHFAHEPLACAWDRYATIEAADILAAME